MLVSIWWEVSSTMPTTQDLWSVHSSMPKISLHIGEASTVEDCKQTHTHTHTHTERERDRERDRERGS